MKGRVKKAHDANYKQSVEPKGLPEVNGYDFNEFDLSRKESIVSLLDSFSNVGMQASNLGKAIEIAKEMRKEGADIFLAYNSNMVSSGIRDIIRYLVEHKMVKALITTTGGVEEDILKTFGPFYVGDFKASGAELRKKGINRIGNVFVPNDRYIKFEKMMHPFLAELLEEQRKTGHAHTPSEFIYRLGMKVEDKRSIYYWASRNNIPVFCPALTDGSIGDMIYFFRESDKKNADLKIDIASDMNKLVNMVLDARKTGVIVLGGGIIKHHIMNANLYRNGAEYTIYINTEIEEGGSDSGARPDEAVSWGKLKPGAKSVKVFCDATIAFPIIVAAAFKSEK
ncbi:MAG: deoxyhypusine synthase [Candidatus Micrarchaeota archaeon]|nr:deoxyhypusine synthase [Candidatus Micrarchaeota archaeon]